MNKNWSNTVLVAFSALPKIQEELDFAFNSRLKSTFRSIHLKNGVSTEKLVKEMIEINDRKRKTANLHLMVSAALNLVDEPEKRVLTARFIDNKTFQETAETENISLRTVFRRFDRAQESFACALRRQGMTEELFAEEYCTVPQIKAISERLDDSPYFAAKSQK